VGKCHSHITGCHNVTSHNRSHDRHGKVVHRPCSSCISSVENLMGTLSSSLCQNTEQRAVGLIPAWSLAFLQSCPYGNIMEERCKRGWKKKEFSFLFIFNWVLLVYIFVMYVWSRDEITQSKTGLLWGKRGLTTKLRNNLGLSLCAVPQSAIVGGYIFQKDRNVVRSLGEEWYIDWWK